MHQAQQYEKIEHRVETKVLFVPASWEKNSLVLKTFTE